MKLKLLIAFAALTSMACTADPVQWGPDPITAAESADVRADAGSSFRLRPGEFAVIDGSDLLVGFRGVRSDSRCPQAVTCVWQGDAEVVVGTAANRGSWSWTTLHTGVEPRALHVDGYSVRLVDVEPAPLANRTIDPEQYRIVLQVDRE